MMLRNCLGCVLCLVLANLATAKDDVPANLIAGKKVPANAKLKKGEKLVAWYEKKAYLVEILDVRPNNLLKILWVESKEESDDVRPDELYEFGDSSTLRKSRTGALPEAYRSLDKNADGQISLSEWDRTKYAEFRRLDKNGDGILTPKELTSKGASTTAMSGKEVKPAPVNLAEYADKTGQTFTFTVTGSGSAGEVRGTGTYSTTSNLAAAAVHAGVVKEGETRQISVTISTSTDKFSASTANGVTSLELPGGGPAFTMKAAP
jgi:hypothetical protein